MSNPISDSRKFLSSRVYAGDMAGRPPTKPAPSFGTQLAATRKARGLSQQQLAESLGISVDMLTYYERRAKNPSADIVGRAAGLLGVTSDDLIGSGSKARKKSGPPSQIEQRLTAVRQLPREKQKVVLQLLDSFLQSHGKAAAGG